MSSAAPPSSDDPSLPAAALGYLEAIRGPLTGAWERALAFLMGAQYVAFLVVGIAFSPELWSPLGEDGHHVLALFLGTAIAAGAMLLALRKPGQLWTRFAVGVGQMLMAALFIHLTAGRPAMHFYIFVSLAFLALYLDWQVLAAGATVSFLDLAGRGIWWPASLYGSPAAGALHWVEEAAWLLFETGLLILGIRYAQDGLWRLASHWASLEQARAVAEAESASKDEFIATISHELRTPLTPALMTLTSMADDPRLESEVRDEVLLVRRNVELEARLIDDLLDVTRIARGKLQIQPGHLDLHTLLTQLVETCQMEMQEKGLQPRLELSAQRHWLYADGARMQQVFWNLLKNAIKFTPAGGQITVRTQDAGDRVMAEIIDTGIGIDAEVLPKLFQRFEQGSAQVTRQFGGLGLGLSICRSIVELHRGAIRAESRGLSWGSTFTVILPARGAAAIVPKGASTTQLLRLSGKLPSRVLLVDDHPDTREALGRLLTRAGYQVKTAASVQGALKKAAASQFDLVVSDLGLPDGSGCDLMRTLKAQYGLPGVAFSGYGMEEDVKRSLAAGFAVHLTKPVDLVRLKEAMTQALNPQGPGQ